MKILRFEVIKPLNMAPLNKNFWKLTSQLDYKIVTDIGSFHFIMDEGWMTDLRSGTDVINYIVPKWGNETYLLSVLAHDFLFSGFLSFDLANDILLKGMIFSGEIGEFRAKLVRLAVEKFGYNSYYDMDEIMPDPYEANRALEHFQWEGN